MTNKFLHLLYVLPLLMAAGCDTTEETFIVGGEPKEENFLNVDKALLSFSPEGGSQEIQITSIASWEVTLVGNNQGQFSVTTPETCRGNGTITVTCKGNKAASSFSAEIQIRPINFEMDPVKVTVSQANSTFSIDAFPASDPTPEEGGSLSMTAYSTLDWKLEVLDIDGVYGDPDWLTITPSLEGLAQESNRPIEFRFVWSPNYTNAERNIRFCMVPASGFELDDLPRPFTLTQQAGSLPQSVRGVMEKLDIMNADFTLEYSSRSPMKDCGLYLYKVVSEGEDALVGTYRPSVADGVYDKNGFYSISISELQEDTKFRIVPFAVNEVGMMTGDPREFTTGIKPENMMYDGVSIIKSDNGDVTVETTSDVSTLKSSATFSVVVKSDVTPIDNKIESAVLSINGSTVDGNATSIGEGSYLYVFKATNLVPNTKYNYSITFTSADLPRSQGQMRNKTVTASGNIKTPGLTPGVNDNDKPNSGE